jgi:CRP-like cAMP-binding protein
VISAILECFSSSGRFLAAGTLSNWIVPALIAVVVIVGIWLGWRWMRTEHLETLGAIPLFSGLSENELLTILSSARVVEFAPGTSVVSEGEQGKGFYVITKGNARVTVEGKEVAKLEEGAYFGEIAALDGGARTATITATSPVTTLELTRSALLHILDKEPAVATSVYQRLVEHLKDAGGTPPMADETQVTSAQIAELAQRLRHTEHPGWGTTAGGKRLSLTKMFAKGS